MLLLPFLSAQSDDTATADEAADNFLIACAGVAVPVSVGVNAIPLLFRKFIMIPLLLYLPCTATYIEQQPPLGG